MNKQRRKTLAGVKDLLSQAVTLVDQVRSEEQDAFDNLPENLQDSDRAANMEEAISELEEAMDCINDASEHLDEASNK